jgi:hypothetical protein
MIGGYRIAFLSLFEEKVESFDQFFSKPQNGLVAGASCWGPKGRHDGRGLILLRPGRFDRIRLTEYAASEIARCEDLGGSLEPLASD